MKLLHCLLTSFTLSLLTVQAGHASSVAQVVNEPRIFVHGRAVTNSPVFRIEGTSLTLNGVSVWQFNEQDNSEQRELAAETKRTIEMAVARGDVLLFGQNYRVIKTGGEADDFLSAARHLRDTRKTVAPLSAASVRDLQKQLRISAPEPLRELEQGYFGQRVAVSNQGESNAYPVTTALEPAGLSVDSTFDTRPHHFAILRPVNFHFGGVFGNDNGGYVWNKLVAIGYSGEDYIDSAMTAGVFYDEVKAGNGNGVIFIQTHGANEGLVVETFRHSNYSPIQTTLTAPCNAGSTSITVDSTAGLPASGNIVIKTLFGDDLIWYEAKTATILTGIPSDGDDGIGGSHASGETVEWTQAQQAEDAAYNARSAYYDRPEFDYGDIDVASISANLVDPRPAYVLVITPQFIQRNGALSNTLVYADACESAGCPDRSATELDEAFLAAGVENYLGYNVSASANWYLWWLPGNSPKMVGDFFDKITAGMDRKTVGDAHADIVAYQPSLIRCAKSTTSANQVLYYCGDLSAQTIPPEGDVVFSESYTFAVAVTNRGNYTEEYQVNLTVHNAQYQELATIIQGPINCPAHQSRTVSVTWPVDPAHGVVGAATYKVGIGLWPYQPDYTAEPIIDILGYYTYTVRSLPNIPLTGRVTRQDNGQGLDSVSIGFSAGGGTVTSAGGGYFSNSLAYGWSGTVTPSMTGWQFSPSIRSYSSPVTSAQSSQDFIASVLATKRIETISDAIAVEEGTTSLSQFQVRLSENPGSTVTVTVARISGDSDLAVTGGNPLTFNSANWQTFKAVQVSAAEDVDKVSSIAIFRCSATGFASKDVSVSEIDNDGGAVLVLLLPSGAVAAGAQWRINDGSWHNSGEVASDGVPWEEDFTIRFKDIPGWFTAPSISTHLNSAHPFLSVTGSYIMASSESGSLQVEIEPASAVSAGAQWRVDNGQWRNSGDSAPALASGTHLVEFAPATGFVKPGGYQVNINGGNTTTSLGLYSPLPSALYVTVGQSIQNAINSASVGQHVILSNGTFSVTSTLVVANGIILRSLNGFANSTINMTVKGQPCLSVNSSNAILDGLTLTGADTSQNGNGGGVQCSAGTILNCRMYSNVAGNGGGVYCGSLASLNNCWVEGNKAYGGGGGVFISTGSRLDSCVIKNNIGWSSCEGGGFNAQGGTLVNCLVTANNCDSSGGGGVVSDATLDQCVVAANIAGATSGGGGLEITGMSVVRGCKLLNNRAEVGGGFDHNGSELARLENCIVSGNQSVGGSGGGGWCERGLVISNCIVAGNASSDLGGGLASFEGFTAYSTIISNNNAQTKGGGVYSEGDNTLINCLICRNTASGDAGGVWNFTGSIGPVLNNCTICYNQAGGKGGGIYSDGNSKSLLVRNCIVMSNTASGGNANYFEWDSGDLWFAYSCSSPLPTGIGNTNVNPRFVNVATNNFHLLSTSPCIDKGTNTGAPTTDIDGIPRPLDGDGANGAVADMGAYEYVPLSGSVIVRIDPIYAVDTGAKWTLDGNTWYSSDARVDYIPVGTKTVSFTNVSGWAKPSSISLSIVSNNVCTTNGVYLPLSGDTDGDEIPDEWEIESFGRLTNVCFASDFDGDLLPDYYEFLSGSDPRNPQSCIVFNEGGISYVEGQGIQLRWYSGSGMSYRICGTTNLIQGFQVIDSAIPASAPMNFYSDPRTNGRSMFYRIEKNP